MSARDYAIVSPAFWTGSTGRSLRALPPPVRLVALYLLTGPHSTATGLYYLPLTIVAHEVGIPSEGASKALRSLSEADFAHYDEASETVWVREMARFQIAERLDPADKRRKWVEREIEKHRKSRYFNDFLARYADAFGLTNAPNAPAGPGPSGGAPKPLRSQDQEQEQDQEQDIPGRRPAAAPQARAPRRTVAQAPPTVDDVRAEVERRGLRVDPEAFVAHYTANGWKVGKAPMVSWHAALTTWEKNGYGNGNGGGNGSRVAMPRRSFNASVGAHEKEWRPTTPEEVAALEAAQRLHRERLAELDRSAAS